MRVPKNVCGEKNMTLWNLISGDFADTLFFVFAHACQPQISLYDAAAKIGSSVINSSFKQRVVTSENDVIQ